MAKNKSLFDQLLALSSEQRNKSSMQIDTMSTSDILSVINREDQSVAKAVKKELRYIRKAVELIVNAFSSGGRLIYVGAGTSGRLGILDASECPPTFGTSPELVQGIIAGGERAVFQSQEGAEDNVENAILDIRQKKISSRDVVCGIAASMRTPYVRAALIEAKGKGAKTILVTTNPRSLLKKKEYTLLRENVDIAICPVVGPEVIMGSTRMKAGTAQKMVLNMLTTAPMIRLGKVYGNMMVDLKMTSAKLEERAKRVLMISTGVDYDTSSTILSKAGGHVKTAIVMVKNNVTASEAKKLLKKANGFVAKAVK